MAKEKRKHLGRGLASLLGPITSGAKPVELTEKSLNFPPDKELQNSIMTLALDTITANPYQPRSYWNEEELSNLADSIRANGVIQPILVRPAGKGYEVIAGERRLRAALLAGLSAIPAIVREATDEQMLELALIENIHRADLNPIERAMAYQNFIETFDVTQTEAAQRLGEDRSVIANYIRLLDLPKELKDMLIDRSLSMGHARAILALPTDDLKRKLANRALAGRLSVREIERIVRRQLQRPVESEKTVAEKPPHIVDLENRLRASLGTKVQISTTRKGQRGRIIIDFYSLDEFDKLAERMGVSVDEDL